MSVVITTSPGAEARVTFGVSALAELTAILHALADWAHHPAQRHALVALRQQMSASLSEELRRWNPLWRGYRCRLLYPGVLGLGNEFERELDGIASVAGDEFDVLAGWAISGGYTGRDYSRLRDRATAREDLVERARARGSGAHDLALSLLNDREMFREELIDVLRRAHAELLAPTWLTHGEVLAAVASGQRLTMAHRGVSETLAALWPATETTAQPEAITFHELHEGRINLTTQPLLIMATQFGAPHLLIKHEPGWPAILQFDPAVLKRARATPFNVQRRLSVLASPGYLRLAGMLAYDRMSTVEIARRTSQSASHVSRQLRTLRELGLVNSTRDGSFVYYSLNLTEVGRLGVDLLEVLLS